MQKSTRQKLTEATIEALPVDGRDTIHFDAVLAGFGVRITPAGARIYIAQARLAGKPKRVPVGRWPAMKLAVARAEARQILDDLRSGKDPGAAKAIRAAEIAASGVTVSDLADRWLNEHVRLKRKPRTIADYENLIETKIKPAIGNLSVSSVRHSDVLKLHRDLAAIPRRANYVIAVLKAMFGFAERVDLRPQNTNPAKGVEMYRERERERFLDPKEIGAAAELIAKAEAAGRLGPHVAAGLRLALFTGARSGEVTAVEWSHVDLKAKVIRLPDSKTNRPRIIHLNGPAIETIKALPRVGKFVIAGAKENQPAKNLGAAWIKIRKDTPLADVRLHDLRHSFASAAVARGLSLPMIGKLLGHTVPATTARYAHLAQDPVAEANAAVAEVYEAAAAGNKPLRSSAKVIPLQAPKRKVDKRRTNG